MALGIVLREIAQSYSAAYQEPFKNHPLAILIRREWVGEINELLGPRAKDYVVKGSAGQGRWSESPWLAILDPVVTTSAERGYYPVFLFSEQFDQVSLVLGQGTYSVREEFGREGPKILEMRAVLLRQRVPEFTETFVGGPFPIKGSNHAGGDWASASAWGKTYQTAALPGDSELGGDLHKMLQTYHLATSRGGTNLEEDDGPAEDASDGQLDLAAALDGKRRERLHARIETQRNRALAEKAKKFHGLICKACGFDFHKIYGESGYGCIEAHHLVPLSQLAKDGPIPLSVAVDFTVLCANCHRMIHRQKCPSLDEFKRTLLK